VAKDTTLRIEDCIDRTAIDRNGKKIGTIADIYVDDDTNEPEWFAITSGLFGRKVSFAPIGRSEAVGDAIELPYDADHIKDAPSFEADGQLSAEEEAQLYAHYGVGDAKWRSEPGRTRTGRSDEAMTRSEQELHVDKQDREVGRARLRKWVETEHAQVTVPIRREKAKLVTEPITDENRDKAMSGPEISEGEHEVTLHEEEPVVQTRTVPKERVRLEKESETEERPVEAELEKERIEMEGGRGTRRDR
jgi:stress response protein YsnF/sporulation protein YlmC with PRC-barrel domain